MRINDYFKPLSFGMISQHFCVNNYTCQGLSTVLGTWLVFSYLFFLWIKCKKYFTLFTYNVKHAAVKKHLDDSMYSFGVMQTALLQ